ncbi:MAG: hypothetical protein HZA17_10415 [Nitrospirae bacterium]|nr:hypothetical protein [Nitrospirota bacterium]
MASVTVQSRTPGCLPFPLIIIVIVASSVALLRSGYLVSVWTLYRCLGTEISAVVEQSEQYQALVRKPRPATYIRRCRGTYGFDINQGNGRGTHVSGHFDTGEFGLSGDGLFEPGDRISVVYLKFASSRSRPAGELGGCNMLIALIISLASLFLLIICVASLHAGKEAQKKDSSR